MIRPLERTDYQRVYLLLQEFAQETGLGYLGETHYYDYQHIHQVLLRCERAGVSFVAQNGRQITGMFLSLTLPDLWIPTVRHLKELAWYVQPEFRGTSLGARLFFAYVKEAEKRLEMGHIQGYTMTKLSSSDNFDYERRGMRLIETTYLREA